MSSAESSDDENVAECQARRRTAKMRVHKYLAAKASSSKAGRELIQKGLGEQGGELLDVMQRVMEDFTKQNPEAKLDPEQMKKCLFKIVVKCAVFLDNGVLEEAHFNDVSVAAANLAWRLIDMCELSMVYNDTKLLTELVDTIHTGMHEILGPVVTGKSLKRLDYLQHGLSQHLFDFLLRNEENAKVRADVGNRVLKVVETRKIPRPAADNVDKTKLGSN